jgi:hypothetical protein
MTSLDVATHSRVVCMRVRGDRGRGCSADHSRACLVACQGADAEDLNKKLRALNKKLRQVEDLRAKQTAGAVLEGNQVSSPRASVRPVAGGADW